MNFKLDTPVDAPFRKNVYLLQIRLSSSIALHRERVVGKIKTC
jgi:hypothetical protein